MRVKVKELRLQRRDSGVEKREKIVRFDAKIFVPDGLLKLFVDRLQTLVLIS